MDEFEERRLINATEQIASALNRLASVIEPLAARLAEEAQARKNDVRRRNALLLTGIKFLVGSLPLVLAELERLEGAEGEVDAGP